MLRFLKTLALIILTLVLAYVTSVFIWQFFSPTEKEIPLEKMQKITRQVTLPYNIFGVKKIAPIKKNYAQVKKTKLDVTLVGIIKKTADSVAIIKLSSGLNKAYHIGEKISGLAKIKDIENNFVIINYNGKDEKLAIDYKTTKDLVVGNKQNNTVVTESAPQDIVLNNHNKIKIKKYLAQAATNPASLLKVIRVEPRFINGLLSGFSVYPGKEKQLFQDIGFQAGDIILEINDIALTNLQAAFSIGRDLAKKTQFDFIILRKNVKHFIHFDLN